MKNVLTNLTEEPPQLWLFQSPSSRFIMTQTFMKFASERAREESSSKMSVWETLRLDHVKWGNLQSSWSILVQGLDDCRKSADWNFIQW